MLGVTGAEKPEPARIFMHGQPTFKFAVKAVPYCIDEVLKRADMQIEDVDFFVFHQANARIIDLAARKYHIPPEKYYKNIQKYGNTSAASIPLVISELHDLGKVGPGSRSWWWASAAASPGAAPWWNLRERGSYDEKAQ